GAFTWNKERSKCLCKTKKPDDVRSNNGVISGDFNCQTSTTPATDAGKDSGVEPTTTPPDPGAGSDKNTPVSISSISPTTTTTTSTTSTTTTTTESAGCIPKKCILPGFLADDSAMTSSGFSYKSGVKNAEECGCFCSSNPTVPSTSKSSVPTTFYWYYSLCYCRTSSGNTPRPEPSLNPMFISGIYNCSSEEIERVTKNIGNY
ncbi:cell wall integrity and stress response component 2, partial [Eurytemora carolleeae]|uniref:cell wall integrity and stress response component 2 n=1 Tax=Eurytemora carolleeae TaxID=1294199 RepID=UPI000C77579A